MDSTGMSYLLSQLGYSVPSLLVYLVAFILALVFMKRAPGPSTLTLLAVGVLVLATIGTVVAQSYLIQSMQTGTQSIRWQMDLVGIAGLCARTIGLSLLVAAIFVGRGRDKRQDTQPKVSHSTGESARGKEGEAGHFHERRGL